METNINNHGELLREIARQFGDSQDLKAVEFVLSYARKLDRGADAFLYALMLFAFFSRLHLQVPEKWKAVLEAAEEKLRGDLETHVQKIAGLISKLPTQNAQKLEAFLHSERFREAIDSIAQKQAVAMEDVNKKMEEHCKNTWRNLALYENLLTRAKYWMIAALVSLSLCAGWSVWNSYQARRELPREAIQRGFSAYQVQTSFEEGADGCFITFQLNPDAEGKGIRVRQKAPGLLVLGLVNTNAYPSPRD
ncbi:MAG TPA: hypothetical protein VN673_17555 [Clostridia bacterium]|nr:hypothetical protein [Clostridia bacterium]